MGSGEASRNLMRGVKYKEKIKYCFINLFLNFFFVIDMVFYVVIVKNESIRTRKIYLSNDNLFIFRISTNFWINKLIWDC
jgi:hypothetical protein